jgi:hypothetical protein
MIKPHTRGRTGSALRSFATRFLALSVLVSMIASLAIATPAMAADTVAAATDTVAAAPIDVAQANPFSDVPENSWAYDAVRQLAAAGLVTGYPDNTFKGNRPMTRYEMAVLVNRAVNAIQSKIAQAGAGSVKQADLDALKRLIDAFRPELAQVQAALRALQAQTAALSSKVDANQAALKAQQDQLARQLTADEAVLRATASTVTAGSIHPKMWNRAMTYNQSMTLGPQPAGYPVFGAANAPGVVAVPATIAFGTLGGQATVQTPQIGRSTNFEVARVDFTGSPDPRIQWGVRLEQISKWAGTINSGASAVAPGFCQNGNTNLSCATSDYSGGFAGNAGGTYPVRMAYGYFGYFSPGGFFAKIGRIGQDEGRNADGIMLGGAQANGVQIGYKDARWYGYVFPSMQGNSFYNTAIGNTTVAANGLPNGTPNVGQCPFGYGGNTAAANAPGAGANVNSSCISKGTDGMAAMLEYYNIPSRTAVGVTYDGYNNVVATGWNQYAGLCVGAAPTSGAGNQTTTTPGAGSSTWNTTVVGTNGYCAVGRPLVAVGTGTPLTGAYQSVPASIKTGGAYVVQYLGNSATPQFRLTAEVANRFGNDPFTGAAPTGGGATSQYSGKLSGFYEVAFASKGNWNGGPLFPASGIRNSNVLMAQYYSQGFNSISLDDGVTGTGAFDSAQQYLGNYAGMKWLNLYASHWFTNQLRAGLTYYVLANSFQLPAGSSTCPGCSLGSYVMHSLGVDIFLSF